MNTRTDGRFFYGTELHDHVEVANVEFGKVKFAARVNSRREFHVEGTCDEVLTLRGKFAAGQYAPLTVAAEYLGNAYLDEVHMSLAANGKSRITVVFVYGEVMPI